MLGMTRWNCENGDAHARWLGIVMVFFSVQTALSVAGGVAIILIFIFR